MEVTEKQEKEFLAAGRELMEQTQAVLGGVEEFNEDAKKDSLIMIRDIAKAISVCSTAPEFVASFHRDTFNFGLMEGPGDNRLVPSKDLEIVMYIKIRTEA